VIALALALCFGGCANKPVAYDYTAFRAANPASLLVLPPINDSADIKASAAVWSNAVRPLAENGYYVLPVTLVDETLKQNGIQSAHDAHAIPQAKLREVFGADAAVYVKVTRYGTTYLVVGSETRVDVEARIVDLRRGDLLWAGKAMATSAEQGNQTGGGLVGLLVTALVKQIVASASDATYNYAAMADARLFGRRFNGVLAGPRSPNHGTPPPER
jgi:hypothetical protein